MKWLGLLLGLVVAVVASQDNEIEPGQLAPQFPELTVFSLGDDILSGEIKFEKAFLEFTEHMNGYAAYIAHSCDEFLTLMDAQSDAQNPAQLNVEQKILDKEAADANSNSTEATDPSPSPAAAQWPPAIPESLIPIGWREKMKNVQVPSMVDNALQSDVEPFIQFMRDEGTVIYTNKFSVSVPSIANVIVLYGGMFMPDPKFEALVKAKKVKKNDKPRTVFVPLSTPIIMKFRRDKEDSLYRSPLSPRLEGYVANGTLNGVLTFSGAFYENLVPGYVVLFGTGPHAHDRLGTEYSVIRGIQPIGRRATDGRYQVNMVNVQLAPHVTHVLVFGGHPHNCNRPAAVNLFPVVSPSPAPDVPVIPDATTVDNLRFVSEGPKNGFLTGTLQWDRAADEGDLLGYVIQWAEKPTLTSRVPLYGGNPLTDFSLGSVWKASNTPIYTVELNNVRIPRTAHYLRVSGFSHYDKKAAPAAAPKPFGVPAFVSLTGEKGTH